MKKVRSTNGTISKKEKRGAKRGNFLDRVKIQHLENAIAAEKGKKIKEGGVAADMDTLKLALVDAVDLGLFENALPANVDDMVEDEATGSKPRTTSQSIQNTSKSKPAPKPVKQSNRIKAK
ncbi:hypothetical protein HDU97_002574 [Phlyctochytrium planicorne]|nr:hypothetical protein HDU97_002574 [Phlyctochytrium planicorne]